MRTGIVLGAAAQNLDDALDLVLAADDGVEVALLGQLGQVAAKGLERGRLDVLLAARDAAFALGPGPPCEDDSPPLAFLALAFAGGKIGIEFLEHFVAGALDVDLEGLEHARGHAVAFAQQAEQDVLGADVGVIERLGFLAGEREDLLHARRVGDVARHLGVRAGADLLFHLDADGLEIEAELLQHIDRDALPELDQPEQAGVRCPRNCG